LAISVSDFPEEENDEILHAPAENSPHEDPQRSGQIPKLRRQHGPDQRSGASNGSKMVAENNPLICRNEVATIFEALGGRGTE
jgi:hypothetical protein